MAKLSEYEKNKRMMTKLQNKICHLENKMSLTMKETEFRSYKAAIANLTMKFNAISKPCTGEAHGNPHIDNCGMCAPFWSRYPKGSRTVPADDEPTALTSKFNIGGRK